MLRFKSLLKVELAEGLNVEWEGSKVTAFGPGFLVNGGFFS